MYPIGTPVTISPAAKKGGGEQGVIDCGPLSHNGTITPGRPLYPAWSICKRLGTCTVLTQAGHRVSVLHEHLEQE